jgi:hypothetical protein
VLHGTSSNPFEQARISCGQCLRHVTRDVHLTIHLHSLASVQGENIWRTEVGEERNQSMDQCSFQQASNGVW